MAAAKHLVVLNEPEGLQRRRQSTIARPVDLVILRPLEKEPALDDGIALEEMAEETSIVGMADARQAQQVQRNIGRADRAEVAHGTGAVRPYDKRRLALALQSLNQFVALGGRVVQIAGIGIDRSERRQMIAERDDDGRSFAVFRPFDQARQEAVGIERTFGIGQYARIHVAAIGAGDFECRIVVAAGFVGAVILQGHPEEEERLLDLVGLPDEFFDKGAVRGFRATLLKCGKPFLGAEFIETEFLVDRRTVPEPFTIRMQRAGHIAEIPEHGGERRRLVAYVLLVWNAAIRQESVREAGQRLKFDIGGKAAHFRRKNLSRRVFAEGGKRIGLDRHPFEPPRIPQGFHHDHDDVRFFLRRDEGAGSRDGFHGLLGISRRSRDHRHRHVHGEGGHEAVMPVIGGLVPHHRLQAEEDAQLRERAVVEIRADDHECGHRYGHHGDTSHGRQGFCAAIAQYAGAEGGEECDRDRDGGRQQEHPVLGQQREEIDDLAQEDEVRRIERCAEKQVLHAAG